MALAPAELQGWQRAMLKGFTEALCVEKGEIKGETLSFEKWEKEMDYYFK